MLGLWRVAVWLGAVLVLLAAARASAEEVPLDSERWAVRGGQVVDHLGRRALAGTAFLPDLRLGDGVIEVDLALDGSRAYPGVAFRVHDEGNYELVYVRPHNSGRSDALQYAPVCNGVTGWQLYSGDGFTASVELPTDRWLHLRIEVAGDRARVFLDGDDQPALVVDRLRHGASPGFVGLVGGSPAARFAGFRVDARDDLDLGPPLDRWVPPGAIMGWDLSRVLSARAVDPLRPPAEQRLGDLGWTRVEAEPSGLVDVARHRQPLAAEPSVVLARAVVTADAAGRKLLRFGYSDRVSVFANGELRFEGDSSYRLRDPSFLGIVGPFDAVPVDVVKGTNEILLAVTEAFGGWGFLARLEPLDGRPLRLAPDVKQEWRLTDGLARPESAAWDPEREVLYVSSFGAGRGGYVSRVGIDGRLLDREWLAGLAAPSGLALSGDRLYVVERSGVAEVDVTEGAVTRRTPCPADGLLNDVAVAADGVLYVSDSRLDRIFRVQDGVCEPWVSGWPLDGPNGLLVVGDRLVVFTLGGKLITFDRATARPTAMLDLDGSMGDGVRAAGNGGFIVSDYRGRLLRVSLPDRAEVLVDGTSGYSLCADLEVVPEHGLVVVPSFDGGDLTAYRVESLAPED